MKKFIVLMIMVISLAGILAFDKEKMQDRQMPDYAILQKWELPGELEEISGIDWIGENTIAAVQDEDGILFIYDLQASKITKEIKFGGRGDYEGIRISRKDAYILRSDGTIFKVTDFQSPAPKITEHKTDLSFVKGVDIEGLCLDKQNARLLLAEKERKGNSESRGIYAVTLNLRTSWDHPALKIDLNDAVLQKAHKKPRNRFYTSEMALHPKNDNYYLLDAKNPKLLIMSPGGELEKLYFLDEKDFQQPEGITFDPAGNMYISNEAGGGPANILKVALQ